jgi:hypothetical protein
VLVLRSFPFTTVLRLLAARKLKLESVGIGVELVVVAVERVIAV